jgi:hypothetical protein
MSLVQNFGFISDTPTHREILQFLPLARHHHHHSSSSPAAAVIIGNLMSLLQLSQKPHGFKSPDINPVLRSYGRTRLSLSSARPLHPVVPHALEPPSVATAASGFGFAGKLSTAPAMSPLPLA